MSDFEWSSGEQYAPEGMYEAQFKGYDLLPANEQYPESVRWNFVIKGSNHDGKLTNNIGPKKPTDANISGRIIRGLLGTTLKPGDKPDVSSCVGKVYKIAIQNNKNGRAVVGQVAPK